MHYATRNKAKWKTTLWKLKMSSRVAVRAVLDAGWLTYFDSIVTCLQCSSNCGRGVRTRNQYCAIRLESGRYKQQNLKKCESKNRLPEKRHLCHGEHCPSRVRRRRNQWALGPWSEVSGGVNLSAKDVNVFKQCSATCGRGVSKRTITCKKTPCLGKRPPEWQACNQKTWERLTKTLKLTVTGVKHHPYQVHQNDSICDMLRQTAWTRWPHVKRLSFVTTCVFMKTFASYVVRHVKVKNCTFTTRHYYLSSSSSTYYTSNQFNLELQLIKKLLSPLCCYLK